MRFFGLGKAKQAPQLAAQNVRFEIAWTIPRQKFLDPKQGEKAPAPWWADADKFRSEAASEPRYAELKKLVLQYGGEIALYEITSFEGEENLKERLVRHDGANKAPLRKDVLQAPAEMQAALAELEALVRSRQKTATASGPVGGASRKAKPKQRSLLHTALVGLVAVEGLAVAAFAGFVCYRLFPAAPPPERAPVPDSFYVTRIVTPLDGTICEVTSFDNRTGRQSYLGKHPCSEATATAAPTASKVASGAEPKRH